MGADTYPLGPEWLANRSICPTMPGFPSFEIGADWAAPPAMASEGTVSFEYGCLSAFQVSIYSLDRLPQLPRGISKEGGGRTFYMVAVGCGSYGGVHPQPISEADPYYVGAKLNLLEDDAKAVAYLPRQIGSRLPDEEGAGATGSPDDDLWTDGDIGGLIEAVACRLKDPEIDSFDGKRRRYTEIRQKLGLLLASRQLQRELDGDA